MKVTRAELAGRALDMFRKHGFDAVSVNDIAGSFNVTKGSFYHYFKSKDDILLDYYNNLLLNSNVLLDQILAGPATITNKVKTLTDIAVNATITLGPDLLKRLLVLYLTQESDLTILQEGGYLVNYLAALRTLFVQGKEQGQWAGELSGEDLYWNYIHDLLGLLSEWSAKNGSFDLKSAASKMIALLPAKA
ncbi:helix-turn-helix transcriptional regulator [Schleiferilactobacillus harbinensis]|mgnify:FL=1|jgi:AcrR family transcriptional regulator|uniref:TetR/AcrR family transcriptional regulator n=1 Tax=Schleiferilactobacillus harbinensis TaxID=304207 RepID=A0ABU7T0A4_9LACO|nr:TetR/AcrR family transcriptional regulator [Schleiferilactobacillus harbinensis]MBO3091421.1 helix-turn-helix transcriptional regulator [Schleiferilactobacillus harbinensis]MCT2907791.1 TetR/AcrR family transcriptional regulator [Schleiferilactobacillus harbinensis]QEU48213.1 helix-turn-helix transcriptional regulator [Schleiferilactobacillus harbinensis]GEK05019.1 hypothetical protein LHA01_02580 [Schleiferilactobacillus harbinensis]